MRSIGKKIIVIECILLLALVISSCTLKSVKVENSIDIKGDEKPTITDVNKKNTLMSDENNTALSNTIQVFTEALSTSNLGMLQSIISRKGVVIIRKFVSGNGMRGLDIRDNYFANEIPNDIKFPVKGEAAIVLKDLFKGTLKVNDKDIPVKKIEISAFDFKDGINSERNPTSSEVQEMCGKIRNLAGNASDFSPMIFALGEKEIALTESIVDYNVGDWAIFEKYDNKYFLRAIMDFR